jgi:GGDEF domain-containing protein
MLGLSKRPSISSDEDKLLYGVKDLLKAMQKFVIVADQGDAKRFQKELAALENGFEAENTSSRVKAVTDIVEQYADRANQIIGRQRSEMMTVVSELTSAMAAIPDIQASLERLNSLEAQIQTASTAQELQIIKAALTDSVALSRTEALKQKQQISDMISGCISRMRNSEECAAGARPSGNDSMYSPDPLTGLPGRAHAEAELARILVQSPTSQIAAFVVKRFQLINAKFGFRRGDQVLLSVVQLLAQALPDFNNLFRWTPCSFLTIAAPALMYQEVRRKVQLIDLHRTTVTLEWEGHSALIPINLNSHVLSLRDFTSPDELFQKLDLCASEP